LVAAPEGRFTRFTPMFLSSVESLRPSRFFPQTLLPHVRGARLPFLRTRTPPSRAFHKFVVRTTPQEVRLFLSHSGTSLLPPIFPGDFVSPWSTEGLIVFEVAFPFHPRALSVELYKNFVLDLIS